MKAVLTDPAEEASGRVMTTFALSGASWLVEGESGRLGGTSAVILSDPRHSMVLPHIVAIAEEYSRRTLVVCSEPLVDLSVQLQSVLWMSGSQKAEGTWPAHKEAWSAWHGVKLGDAPTYDELDAFIDARNAIMHGLGHLTRRQTQKDGGAAAKTKLGTIGIAFNGTRLLIVPSVLKRCAHVARSFIEWLDMEVQSRGLLDTQSVGQTG